MENETVFSQMWDAYRGVILHSIVTSFGLDFLVHDQHGGDVDTIHGVREGAVIPPPTALPPAPRCAGRCFRRIRPRPPPSGCFLPPCG